MNDLSKNAKFALVIGEGTGERGSDKRKDWQDFLAKLEYNAWPPVNTKRIHDNIWLIPLDCEMQFLGRLLEYGRGGKIVLRILFLDEEPDWLLYPPPEKPKEQHSEAI